MRDRRGGFGAVLIAAACVGAAFAASCGSGDSATSQATTGFGGSGAASAATTQHGSTQHGPGGSSQAFVTSTSTGSGGGGGSGTSTNSGGGGTVVHSTYPCPGCMAFPGPGAMTCSPTTLGKPTLVYPTDGLLLPPNMNVLEVQFTPPAGATLFEVDFSNSVTDVRVETTCVPVPDVRGAPSRGCGVTLPQGAWNDIANTNRDGDPVKVTVRATADGSCVTGSVANINIDFAKEDIAGGIYYWQSAVYGTIGGKTGGIYSHDFGTFDPTPTPFYEASTSGTCVGCHNISRDGIRISLAVDDPDGDDEFSDVKTAMLDVPTRSPIATGGKVSPGFQTWTHDHGKMIASTFKSMSVDKGFDVFDGNSGALITTVLLPTPFVATQPDLSKDDASLVFTVPAAGTIATRNGVGDHHFLGGSIYKTTFDAGTNTIGTPTLLSQGSLSKNFYYPAISPDGAWVVLNEAPGHDAFYNANAEVKLVRMNGSTNVVDLPAMNQGKGLSNSWPRWSPFVQTYKGHKILWVTFSSNRDYGLHVNNSNNPDPMNPGAFPNCYPPESPTCLDPNDTTCCSSADPTRCMAGTSPKEDTPQPLSKMGVGYEGCAQPQIWMAAIIIDPDPSLDSSDRSFPAFWLPFQDVNSHNHSAQWVETVQGGGGSGAGGGGAGGAAGAGGAGGSPPMCGEAGATCNASSPCCSDVVCCMGTCADLSQCIH